MVHLGMSHPEATLTMAKDRQRGLLIEARQEALARQVASGKPGLFCLLLGRIGSLLVNAGQGLQKRSAREPYYAARTIRTE